MRTRPLLAAALLALVVPLAACGGDDSSTATEEPAGATTRPRRPPRATVPAPTPPTCSPRSATRACSRSRPTRRTRRSPRSTSRPASTRASTSTSPPRSPSGSASTSPGRRPPGTSSPRAAGTAAGTRPSGSMTPTNDRQEVLDFTEPYNYTPAVVVVAADNDDGQRPDHRPRRQEDRRLQRLHLRAVPQQGPRRSTGYDVRLRHRRRRGLRLRHRHDGAAGPAPNGRLDAVITSVTTAQGYIDAGNPVKIVGDPVFYEPLSVGLRQELGPVVGEPLRGGGRDRRRRCTRTAR